MSVNGASAMASEPRYISPAPCPMASGGPCRARDHQVVVAGEDDGEREGALQAAAGRRLAASTGARPWSQLVGDEVDDGLGVGVGLEHVALGGRARACSSLEVLDDAVVDDRDLVVHVRMRVALGRAAVRRPARVADAGVALQRLARAGASPGCCSLPSARRRSRWPFSTVAMPRRIIAAIFEPPQRIDEIGRDRLLPKYADDPAHGFRIPSVRTLRYDTASGACRLPTQITRMFRRSSRVAIDRAASGFG